MSPLKPLSGLGLALLFASLAGKPAAAMPDGKALFMSRCAMCHQAAGQGMPNVYPPLAGSEFVNGPAAKHIQIVLKGLTGSIKVKGKPYNNVMPAQASLMTDEEIAAVISYERTSWGNHGGKVTVAQVKALRK